VYIYVYTYAYLAEYQCPTLRFVNADLTSLMHYNNKLNKALLLFTKAPL